MLPRRRDLLAVKLKEWHNRCADRDAVLKHGVGSSSCAVVDFA